MQRAVKRVGQCGPIGRGGVVSFMAAILDPWSPRAQTVTVRTGAGTGVSWQIGV